VIKLLNLYSSKDGFDSDKVSKSLIANVQKRLSEMRAAAAMAAAAEGSGSASASSNSLLMDTKFSFAVKFPFNPSTVALEELTVPDSFGINTLVKRL
jgi:myosin-5